MMWKIITVKMESELAYRLDLYAMNHGLTRSEAVRRAIALLIEMDKKK